MGRALASPPQIDTDVRIYDGVGRSANETVRRRVMRRSRSGPSRPTGKNDGEVRSLVFTVP